MNRVVSGVRPTGKLHLGNYFGAIQNFIKLQDEHECFFFVADYHSLTTHPKASELHPNIRETLLTYLACGLDPDKTTLYVQSDVPQIAELYLIFNMLAYVGELERCTTYKDKLAGQNENNNAGLLTYPVLMAVDIIIHHATKVPVGKDQEQHLEMTRNFVNRFNHYYGDYFKAPQAFNYGNELIKIPGLDGKGKMGKSEGEHNAIFLIEEATKTKKSIMRAVTDSGPTEPNSKKSVEIDNLFTILKAVSKPDVVEQYETAYNDCSIRYGDLKKQLADDVAQLLEPIRARYAELESKPDELKDIVQAGAEKARLSASKTIKEVRELIGIKQF